MKKAFVCALSHVVLVHLVSCSLIGPRVLPYPSGLVFPVEEDGRLSYEGEIVDLVVRRDGGFYFAVETGFVYAVDGAARKVLWKYQTENPVDVSLFAGRENIYVVDNQDIVHALDSGGKLIWKKSLDGKVTGGRGEGHGKVYLGTDKGVFLALDSRNGEEAWSFKVEGAVLTDAVLAGERILFGCAAGKLYCLDQAGALIWTRDMKSRVLFPFYDGRRFFFGTADHFFHSIDLEKGRRRWRIKLGGEAVAPPVAAGRNLFFPASNSVIYALNRRSGEIAWWKSVPFRGFYRLELVGDKLAVASQSSLLVCFEVKTGKEAGRFDTELELKANPAWLEPYLVLNVYDYRSREGHLVFLKKEVRAMLTPSPEPPRNVGDEITFTASSVGFHLPRYEFYLKSGDEEEIVQKKSERNSWVWFPEEEGKYIVGVRVTDEMGKSVAEIPFEIKKKDAEAKDKINPVG